MSSSTKQEGNPLLKDAPPPWHSVALLVLFTAIFISRFPSLQSIDEAATIQTFTHIMFPEWMSLKTLGILRVLIAVIIWVTSFYTIFISDGFLVVTNYAAESKLKRIRFRLTGWKSLAPLTHWHWIVLGLAFSLSGAIALDIEFGLEHHVSPYMLRAALICFEIGAPLSFLVSAVVTHAIWPQAVKLQSDLTDLKHPRTLLMHNANVIFSLLEVCLLGGIPVRLQDIALAPLLGCVYVVFAWSMRTSWVDVSTEGPQFLYHFMDTTVEKTSSLALCANLLVLLLAYLGFAQVHSLLNLLGGGLVVHVTIVILLASLVCRFR